MRNFRIAVIGAGIAGASAARNLAERGHQVTIFDQFSPGHGMGSSHGRSRIVRRAYPDVFYTECMKEAYPLWAELERAGGDKLLHEVGLLYFGPASMAEVRATEASLRQLHVPFEKVTGSAAQKLFPWVRLSGEEVALFTPEAGWVDAERALASTLRLAKDAGAELVVERADSSSVAGFDKVVVAAGAWIRDWWREAPVTTTLQTYAYLNVQVSGPVWIEAGADWLYGFPSDEMGLKIGVHRPGRVIDPHSTDRECDEVDLKVIAGFGRRRLGLKDAKVGHGKGCIYTSKETEDFLLSQIDDRMLVASACSGHGFKFGPWFGRLIADLVEDRQDLASYARFVV